VRKVGQKVDNSADIFPSFVYANVLTGPPMQLEDSGGRREDGGENAKRCTHGAYRQLLEVFK